MKRYTLLATEKDTLLTENNTLLTEKDTLLTEKDTLLTEKDTLGCMWCLALFSRKNNKIIHEKQCKMVDDPIRKLEMGLGIVPTLNGNVCRFCDKKMSRKSVLIKHQAQI